MKHTQTVQAGAPETQIAFATEALAREAAAKQGAREIVILHSPHNFNPINESGERWDYFIEPSDTMTRSWETVLYRGKGSNATKG